MKIYRLTFSFLITIPLVYGHTHFSELNVNPTSHHALCKNKFTQQRKKNARAIRNKLIKNLSFIYRTPYAHVTVPKHVPLASDHFCRYIEPYKQMRQYCKLLVSIIKLSILGWTLIVNATQYFFI